MRSLALLSIVLFAGCRASEVPVVRPQPADAPLQTASEQPSGLLVRLEQYGRSFGSSRAELRDRLGPPHSVQVEAQPSRYSSTPDSVFRIEYPGLRFHLLRAGYNGRELLGSVDLWAPGRQLPGGIRVGRTTRGALAAQLGSPAESSMKADTLVLRYLGPDDVVEEFIGFFFVDELLQKVRWDFYVD